MHAAVVFFVLILTYVGMAAGRIAWLRVDRTGIALLAVIFLLASGQMSLDDFGSDVDMPSIALLFAMMIISAQLLESGFIDLSARTITESPRSTTLLLALTVVIGGLLSAVLATDILLIAMTPLLIAGTKSRGFDPRPFVIALAAATNAGAAASLIGSPQNILIGSLGQLGFWEFFAKCGVPALFSLAVVFTIVWLQWRRRIAATARESSPETVPVVQHPFDRNQTIKGAVAVAALLILFATPLRREIGALIIAALLLANRKITSRTMIAAVDWPLLLLVSCLFALTGSLNHSGLAAELLEFLTRHRLLPGNLVLLTGFSVAGANAIGSVPASMLLVQLWPDAPSGVFYSLALLSSLAGNLLLTGSLTTILIAERAERMGAHVSYADYARAGIPITVLSIGFALFWLAATHTLPLTGGNG
jgi:Na+/H+ antiporter NhaD/arsenite permease-like protein